ncbi:MAG: rRNA pseudouridine synthase [Deltaproteobacteria bacterium]|nr:rRNA pseudouridine synthase [Deltaproteobacteria bacterium]
MALERIHKILARSGCASRRKSEMFILQGRVTVNGRIVTLPGSKADPRTDAICLDGKPVPSATRRVVLMLNKPRGVVTTMHDPQGRSTVADLVAHLPRRLFPVGRLDEDSEGLLIMTDDGDLSMRIQHPRHGVLKTYEVLVHGLKGTEQLDRLTQGILLEHGVAKAIEVKLLRQSPREAWISVRIAEGKKRQVRRMCAEVGLHVIRLKRVAIGGLKLGSLRPGAFRALKPDEIRRLLRA